MPALISIAAVQNSVNAACPTNGKVGKHVEVRTIQALLNLPLNILRNSEYRFCSDQNCPTVYYSVDGKQTFTETDLRERVFQKHPQEADTLVCYCFQHTVSQIRTNGKNIATEINQGIQSQQCACDIRNPQGSCCLGNVNSLVKNLQAFS